MDKRKPSILEANYLYMIVAVLLITVGGFFQYRDIYSGIFITEYILILLPMVLFVLFKKYKIKEVFKLKKITLKEILLTILIVMCSYPIALFFNYIMIVIISMFGELQQSPLPVPENTNMFFIGLFLFAITPGICEEVMFRGVMYSAYEKIGVKQAIVITGVLFGMFHFDIQNFLGPTFLGILFAYMVYKTDSLYTTIIAHTVNNSIALILLKFVGNQETKEPPTAMIDQTEILIVGLISLGVISIFLSFVVYYLLKKLSRASGERIKHTNESTYISNEKITIINIIPIILVVFIFIFFVFKYFQYITA